MKERIDENEIDDDNRDTERLSNTEYKQSQLRKFLEKCQKEDDDIAGYIPFSKWHLYCLHEAIVGESISENRYEVAPFYIYLKKEKRNFLAASRVLDRPVKGKKDTGDNDNTR